MKHSLLILILTGCLTCPAWSQTPITYFDHTSFWSYSQHLSGTGMPVVDTETYWTIDGDSSALGQTWYKLYRTGHTHTTYFSPPSSDDTKYAHAYAGLLRQDGKKMRMVFPNTVQDTIIYDFDLQIGEAFFPNLVGSYPPANIVGSINPSFGDTTRLLFKSQAENPYTGNIWVEGIGATQGSIFGPQPIACIMLGCDVYGYLTCYTMQGNSSYGGSQCASAWQAYQAIVQSVDAPVPTVGQVVWLSPNPGHDEIKLHNTGMAVREIRLIDPSGRVVSRHTSVEGQAGEFISLPVGTLPAGVYTVWVYGVNALQVVRWVKI